MSDLPLVSDLPYTLPQTNASKWNYLANLLNIPPAIEINAGEREIDALAATIMYRHLDRIERIEAMTLINSLPNKRLVNMLVTKAVDTKYLNPQWGMWSMTNEELLADERFHQTISNYSSYMGVSASVLGGKDLLSKAWKQRKLGRGGIAMLIIWGVVAVNQSSLSATQTELGRRQNLNQSRFYR